MDERRSYTKFVDWSHAARIPTRTRESALPNVAILTKTPEPSTAGDGDGDGDNAGGAENLAQVAWLEAAAIGGVSVRSKNTDFVFWSVNARNIATPSCGL
ncbi:hypothetical protein E4U31_006917 [Claviceps sp. LM219 group G6]|nr:hypothetical protein E4U31_006917 [Claviceps sp. LM219 group G6]